MQNTKYGVYMTKNGSGGSAIVHTGMEVIKQGINANVQSGNGPVTIANNHIMLTAPGIINSGGVLFSAVNGTFANDLIIDNNLIEISDNSQSGIMVSNINGSLSNPGHPDYRRFVSDNKIYYSGNSSAASNLNSAIKSNGIILNNTQYTNLGCNDVQSIGGGIAHTINAYSINSSTNNKLTCNNANYTSAGFSFKNVCNSTEFKGNTMNEHRNGLFIGNSGYIGTQPFRGNIWQSANFGIPLGTDNSGNTVYERAGYNDNTVGNSGNIAFSRFKNNSNSNTGNAYYEPLSIPNTDGIPYDGGLGSNWFINDQTTPNQLSICTVNA